MQRSDTFIHDDLVKILIDPAIYLRVKRKVSLIAIPKHYILRSGPVVFECSLSGQILETFIDRLTYYNYEIIQRFYYDQLGFDSTMECYSFYRSINPFMTLKDSFCLIKLRD